MRKLILSAALAGTALTLAACSQEAAEPADTAATTDVAATEVVAEPAGLLDASTVTAEQLAAISAVTPELASAIIAGQPYASITDFNAVLAETLSEGEAAVVRNSVFVPINLNSATAEEIALIPGMTERMIHEFEEYRPYADMSDFDREIGKYVDEAEVARLRQYVTL